LGQNAPSAAAVSQQWRLQPPERRPQKKLLPPDMVSKEASGSVIGTRLPSREHWMRWWNSPATIPHTVEVPYVTATVAAEPRPCTAVIEKTAKRERERVKGGVIGKV